MSPLDAALPLRFAKNTQHDTSKVRLPRKMTMDTSKVLRLPRKLQRIFGKRRKSTAPAAQDDFRHVTKHVRMSRSATLATRNEATKCLKPPRPYSNRTDGWERLRRQKYSSKPSRRDNRSTQGPHPPIHTKRKNSAW